MYCFLKAKGIEILHIYIYCSSFVRYMMLINLGATERSTINRKKGKYSNSGNEVEA